MRKTRAEIEKDVDEIFALVRGEPGPFLETEESFFGKKRVKSSMKDAKMETDCGGMVITKSKMTYGEADEFAKSVDISGFPQFLEGLKPSCYWEARIREDGRIYIGSAWWAVYSYLVTKEILQLMTPAYYGEGHPQKRGPESYDNSLEYLYNEVLKRIVEAGYLIADENWEYFNFP